MFLVSRTVETRIVCVPLTSGMFVASLPSFAAVSEPSQEALAVAHQNDVKKMQQALHDRGHYRGRSTASSVCVHGRAFAHFRRPRISQQQGSLIHGLRANSESNQNPEAVLPVPGGMLLGDGNDPVIKPREVNLGLAQDWLKAQVENVRLRPQQSQQVLTPKAVEIAKRAFALKTKSSPGS